MGTGNPVDERGERAYHAEHVRQTLAADPRVSELGVDVEIAEHEVWVRGRVATEERRRAVLAVVREACEQCDVRDGLELIAVALEPDEERLP